MENNNKRKAAAIYSLNPLATSKQQVVGWTTIANRVVTPSTLTNVLMRDEFGSVAINEHTFDVPDADKAIVGEEEYVKLSVYRYLYQRLAYDYTAPVARLADLGVQPVPMAFAHRVDKYAGQLIERLGVVEFSKLVKDASECIFESRTPATDVDRLVCEMFGYCNHLAITYVTLSSRLCLESLSGDRDGSDEFLKRNEQAGVVARELFNCKEDLGLDNLPAFCEGTITNVLHQLLRGVVYSEADDVTFFDGVPSGTPLEKTKTFSAKVVGRALDEHVSEDAYRIDAYGSTGVAEDKFFVTYSEVAKNITKNRGISQFPWERNAIGKALVRAVSKKVCENSFGSIVLSGQDESVNAILNWNPNTYATWDFQAATDSYNLFHLSLFPAEFRERAQRAVPDAVVVKDVSYPNNIMLYMGCTLTTTTGTIFMWSLAYVSVVIARSNVNVPLLSDLKSGSDRIRVIQEFNRRLTDHWKACDFTIDAEWAQEIKVWNDDVILPADANDVFVTLATVLGFTVNKTKSYYRVAEVGSENPDTTVYGRGYRFRESCGAFVVSEIGTAHIEKIPTIPTFTRKPIHWDAMGLVRLASVSEEFEAAGLVRCADYLRLVVGKGVQGGFLDNFSEHGYFDYAAKAVFNPGIAIKREDGSTETIIPEQVLQIRVVPDLSVSARRRNPNSNLAYNIFKDEHYHASLRMEDDQAILMTDEFGIPVFDDEGNEYDFCEYYGIRRDHLTWAQFIKREEDVELQYHEDTHWQEYVFNTLASMKVDIYVPLSKSRANAAAAKLVNAASVSAGYPFSRLEAAIKYMLFHNRTAFNSWSMSQICVALHVLNPRVHLASPMSTRELESFVKHTVVSVPERKVRPFDEDPEYTMQVFMDTLDPSLRK